MATTPPSSRSRGPRQVPKVVVDFSDAWVVFFRIIRNVITFQARRGAYRENRDLEKILGSLSSMTDEIIGEDFTNWLKASISIYILGKRHRQNEVEALTREMLLFNSQYRSLDGEATYSHNPGPDAGAYQAAAEDGRVIKGSIEGFMSKVFNTTWNAVQRAWDWCFNRRRYEAQLTNAEIGQAATSLINEFIELFSWRA